jgi:hypothetical protein
MTLTAYAPHLATALLYLMALTYIISEYDQIEYAAQLFNHGKSTQPKGVTTMDNGNSYWTQIIKDNKALEKAGMPYRYTVSGIAACATCGQTYFRADRISYPDSDCPHYDSYHEVIH